MLGYAAHLLRSFELGTVDTRFSIRGKQPRPEDIAVVEIDDTTFNQLGKQWPFPRHLHGLLIERLTEAGAKAIAYDVQFTEPTVPREDNALVAAVERADGVVLSTTEVNERGESNVFGGEEVVEQIGARAANTTVQVDPGRSPAPLPGRLRRPGQLPGRARRSGHGQGGRPRRRRRPVPTGSTTAAHPGRSRPTPSPRSCAAKCPTPPSAARRRRRRLGAVAAGLPLDPGRRRPRNGGRRSAQANAIWTVENDFPLQSAPGFLNIALIVLFGLVAPAAQLRLRPLPAFAVAVGLGLLFVVAVQLAFDSGWIVSVAYPLSALVLSAVGALAVTALITAYERQQVRDTFARFVPESVVDDVLDRADEDLRLVGVRREGTVMFSDLRGFTSMAESLAPDQVIDVLNHYLSEMSDAIMDHGGTLVAYMGDGIMAVFGAPIEQPDHAERAVAAAEEMISVRLERFNQWIRAQGHSEGLRNGRSASTAAASCPARSAPSAGSSTPPSATRRTPPRASRG